MTTSRNGIISIKCLINHPDKILLSYGTHTQTQTQHILIHSLSQKVKFKVQITLRLAVYRQSVRLGVKPHDQGLFSTEPSR
jgi:hypothetical protein